MLPLLLAAGATVAGSIIGGNAAASGARSAARAEQRGIDFQQNVFDTTRNDNKPMQFARDTALAQYMADLGLPYQPVALPGQEVAQPVAQKKTGLAGIVQRATQNMDGYGASGGPPQYGPRGAPVTIDNNTQQVEATPQADIQYFKPTTGQYQLDSADNFAMNEAITGAQRASGGKLGGNVLRSLSERLQGIASGNVENRRNRLASLIGIGQSATQGTNSQLSSIGNNIQQGFSNQGTARASGYINQGNAYGGGLAGLAQLGGYYSGGGGLPARPNGVPSYIPGYS